MTHFLYHSNFSRECKDITAKADPHKMLWNFLKFSQLNISLIIPPFLSSYLHFRIKPYKDTGDLINATTASMLAFFFFIFSPLFLLQKAPQKGAFCASVWQKLHNFGTICYLFCIKQILYKRLVLLYNANCMGFFSAPSESYTILQKAVI